MCGGDWSLEGSYLPAELSQACHRCCSRLHIQIEVAQQCIAAVRGVCAGGHIHTRDVWFSPSPMDHVLKAEYRHSFHLKNLSAEDFLHWILSPGLERFGSGGAAVRGRNSVRCETTAVAGGACECSVMPTSPLRPDRALPAWPVLPFPAGHPTPLPTHHLFLCILCFFLENGLCPVRGERPSHPPKEMPPPPPTHTSLFLS